MNILQSELWDGVIPIEFQCSSLDIAVSTHEPMSRSLVDSRASSVFHLASRYSYLPLAAERAIDTFTKHLVVDITSEIWFESYNIALKPNLPIGVLFDLLHDVDGRRRDQLDLSVVPDSLPLPWIITINFQRFPSSLIHKVPVVERMFYQSLKQALYLLRESIAALTVLTKEEHETLWAALKTGDFQDYHGVRERLVPSLTSEEVRHIPVRLVSGGIATQRLIPASRELSIQAVTRDYFSLDEKQVMAQGVLLPAHAPLVEVWYFFSSADLFLYLLLA